MISVQIQKKYKDFELNIDFTTDKKWVGILGQSGCGKSMTLKSIAGIVRPDQGRIKIGDQIFFDSNKKINTSVQNRKIGYLFQNYALFPNMTIEENIMSGMHGLNKSQKRRKAEELMHRFQIFELKNRSVFQISGGQQQRVALARIMALDPSVILLDEPFSALDGFLKENMQIELLEMLKDYEGTVVLVTHSRDEIYRFTEEVVVIDQGKQLKQDLTANIFLNPELVQVAKLTDCNNIVEIKKIDEYTALIPEWGIQLHTSRPIREDITTIGIRSHDIRLALDTDKTNCFQVSKVSGIEAPFEEKDLLSLGQGHTGAPLWWKRYKGLEDNLQQYPCRIHIPEEKILLLKK